MTEETCTAEHSLLLVSDVGEGEMIKLAAPNGTVDELEAPQHVIPGSRVWSVGDLWPERVYSGARARCPPLHSRICGVRLTKKLNANHYHGR